MSKLYKTPGEYVQEISALPPTITATETAIPAFVGYTQKAQKLEIGDLAFAPTRIESMPEYEQYFGTRVNETISINITDELVKTGTTISPVSRKIEVKIPFLRNNMHYQLQSYFANGGGPCYIVSVGKPKQLLSKKELKKGLDEVYKYAEPTLLVFPDAIHLAKASDLYALYNEALLQASELGDRFVIMDISHNELQGSSAIELFRDSVTGGENPASLRYGAAYHPFLHSAIPCNYADSTVRITHDTITKEQGLADSNGKGEWDTFYLNNPKLTGTAIYALIKTEIANYPITLSPSPSVAGIFANTDRNRGVWKAPANVALSLVKSPSITINNSEQEILNIDPSSGKSINAIRYFNGKGTLLWGARTLAGNDNEWRYVSVRRLFNMVEESVKKGIAAFAFEPNEESTWMKVKTVIENFLTTLWKAGALPGAKPEHAYFVHAGVGETMTAQDILENKMIIEIGMAPAQPAEFIIFRIEQQMHVS
jgi:phage tail sheath protein FI